VTSESPLPCPCRVLLVDENDAFLDGLTDWFETKLEIDVIGRAHTGDEALRRVSRFKPDLVLIDVGIPEGNGFDVVQSIKVEPTPPLVVVMSFHDSQHIRTTALSNGADGSITKADIPQHLAAYIETIVDHQESNSTTARNQSGRSRNNS